MLSENERLSETGERIHTGASDELTSEFARSFTKHFDTLAAKYPIYAELKNIFDLALVAGLIQSHDLPGQVGWHMTHFADPDGYQVALGPPPAGSGERGEFRDGQQEPVLCRRERRSLGRHGCSGQCGRCPCGRLRRDGCGPRVRCPDTRRTAHGCLVVGLGAVASCRSLPAAVISYLRQETCRSRMWVGMDQFLVRRAEDARPSDPSSSTSSCSSTPIVSSATVPSRVPGSTNMTANSARVSQYARVASTPSTKNAVASASASAASGASTVADNTPSAGSAAARIEHVPVSMTVMIEELLAGPGRAQTAVANLQFGEASFARSGWRRAMHHSGTSLSACRAPRARMLLWPPWIRKSRTPAASRISAQRSKA